MELGSALLTKTGAELAPISGAKYNEEFYEYVIKRWAEKGLRPLTILPQLTKQAD